MASALEGIRILDLSRVLAGPVCTQILADLGAEIIKIEKPGAGDDTRGWGPPFLKGRDGKDTGESAYYLSANRGKRSVTVDITRPEGQAIIRRLIEKSDVVIENFKTGGLDKYGLGYDSLKAAYPRLVYCSITGFGQDGPLASEPGYDFLAQALGGLMASTGIPGGEPMKAGVALSDVMTGLYAAIGILAALRHRDRTGHGQLVDLALLDVTIAGMTNLAQYYLTSGAPAPRMGNAHSTIVPYQTFAAKDGHVVVAIGNDGQFRKFCAFVGKAEWAQDPRFSTNAARVRNRDMLIPMIAEMIARETAAHWVDSMREIDIPAAPVNTMDQVFAMEQVQARGMEISMPHPLTAEPVSLVGSPIKLSETPVSYDLPPPPLGAHTNEVLKGLLSMSDKDLAALQDAGIV